MDFLVLLLIAIFIVLVNGFFVAAEIALIAVRDSLIEEKIREGSRIAKTVKALKNNQDISISTIQLGVSMASLAMGFFSGRFLEPMLIEFFSSIHPLLGQVELAGLSFSPSGIFVFLLTTYILVVVGELLFKAIALQFPLKVSMFIAWPLKAFLIILRPIVYLFNASASFLLALFGLKFQQEVYAHSEDEFKTLLSQSKKAGILLPEEAAILKRTFALNDVIAGELMTPRTEMKSLNINDGLTAIVSQIIESGHSRFPVYDEDPDKMIGFLYTKDLLQLYQEDLETPENLQSSDKERKYKLCDIVRDITVVPETMRGDKLLKTFQSSKKQIALVIDEFGMHIGVITLEDVLETLVGDIQDEYDVEPPKIISDTKGTIINAQMSIEDFNDYFKVKLKSNHSLTIAGYLIELLGHIPEEGERAVFKDERGHKLSINVHKTDGLRLENLLIENNDNISHSSKQSDSKK